MLIIYTIVIIAGIIASLLDQLGIVKHRAWFYLMGFLVGLIAGSFYD